MWLAVAVLKHLLVTFMPGLSLEMHAPPTARCQQPQGCCDL